MVFQETTIRTMKQMLVQATEKTPFVNFDRESGRLLLEGRSIPENCMRFYNPLFKWLDDYVDSPNSETIVSMKLEYLDTSSSKCVLDVLRKFEAVTAKGKRLVVNWYYEEDDIEMKDVGEGYKAQLDFPMNMVEVDELF